MEGSANGEIQLLVTDRAVEFEKYPVQVQDFRQIGDDYKRISRIYPQLHKGKLKGISMQSVGLRHTQISTNFTQNLGGDWEGCRKLD